MECNLTSLLNQLELQKQQQQQQQLLLLEQQLLLQKQQEQEQQLLLQKQQEQEQQLLLQKQQEQPNIPSIFVEESPNLFSSSPKNNDDLGDNDLFDNFMKLSIPMKPTKINTPLSPALSPILPSDEINTVTTINNNIEHYMKKNEKNILRASRETLNDILCITPEMGTIDIPKTSDDDILSQYSSNESDIPLDNVLLYDFDFLDPFKEETKEKNHNNLLTIDDGDLLNIPATPKSVSNASSDSECDESFDATTDILNDLDGSLNHFNESFKDENSQIYHDGSSPTNDSILMNLFEKDSHPSDERENSTSNPNPIITLSNECNETVQLNFSSEKNEWEKISLNDSFETASQSSPLLDDLLRTEIYPKEGEESYRDTYISLNQKSGLDTWTSSKPTENQYDIPKNCCGGEMETSFDEEDKKEEEDNEDEEEPLLLRQQEIQRQKSLTDRNQTSKSTRISRKRKRQTVKNSSNEEDQSPKEEEEEEEDLSRLNQTEVLVNTFSHGNQNQNNSNGSHKRKIVKLNITEIKDRIENGNCLTVGNSLGTTSVNALTKSGLVLVGRKRMIAENTNRPYVCSSCGAGFVRKHDLNRHGKVHSGIKNFKCPYCERAFSRNDALSRHLRVELKHKAKQQQQQQQQQKNNKTEKRRGRKKGNLKKKQN